MSHTLFMKKIILDCDLMRYPDSGLYHYCLNLGIEVQELIKEDKDMSISFFVPESARNAFGELAKCHIEKKRLWPFTKPVYHDCTLWHAPFQSGRIYPGRNKPKGLKVLLTIHDLNPLHEGKSIEEQRKSLDHTQSLIDKADALICISNFCKQDVLKHCDIGNKPVFVIHNGTHKVDEPGLLESSYKPALPFLFAMGYVNTKKNYHVLLNLLKKEGLELVIAGKLDEPDYIHKMRMIAEEWGVADRFHLLGPITEGEKGWYLRNCLAFMQPSLAEGFGAPVVEAMQFGKPLFLSSLTSLPEIGGDAAFYFSSFEPREMQNIFDKGMHTYLENAMMEKIKQRSSEFQWKEKAKQYLQLYKTLL